MLIAIFAVAQAVAIGLCVGALVVHPTAAADLRARLTLGR
jgi:hypothetical protein